MIYLIIYYISIILNSIQKNNDVWSEVILSLHNGATSQNAIPKTFSLLEIGKTNTKLSVKN